MKKMLEKISNNRFSGVGIGAGVTAIIQSSSATSVMVIGLVNAGVMTLMQATPIIMGANIGTTITGVLVALKNDYFNMLMYLLAFAGVMMGFFKKEKKSSSPISSSRCVTSEALWQKGQRRLHPFRKTAVRTPGPSTVEVRLISKINGASVIAITRG